jgi:tRNA U34 2-thiouridine synthase MnmA/TrmU
VPGLNWLDIQDVARLAVGSRNSQSQTTPLTDSEMVIAIMVTESVADKPDSNDICFIPDGDTPGWLSDKIGSADGEIREFTLREFPRGNSE